MHRIETIVEVTDEQINDVVAAALEGGISYWCDQAKTDVDMGDSRLSEMLTKGAEISLNDMEQSNPETNHQTYGVWRTLTLDNLLKALGEMRFNFDDYDAGDADAVVQQAIFGEVIYG